jgi:transposase
MSKIIGIELTPQQRSALESWLRSGKTEQRLALRARMILLSAQGASTEEIARKLSVWPPLVSKWRRRFAEQGLEGLFDATRGGRPARYSEATRSRILAVLDEDPPAGYRRWNGRLVAERLGDVSRDQVWRVLRCEGIQLERQRTWCVSTDPEFSAKAADIVGLYLDPPETAVVLCVDEKPHMQVLERDQGWLRLPDGTSLIGVQDRYKRHGTTTLIGALEVATGLVKADHFRRRRRREFLEFMNELIRDYKDQEIHVVLDNLNIHKPKHDRWLARHKNVHFHFTPTNACWLNQIEIWFSILQRQTLQGASFCSPRQLREAIDQFVQSYNQQAHPFEWRKGKVKQKGFNKTYSDLCN